MSEYPIGYAVVVYNQASHQPDLVDGSFNDDPERAQEIAKAERERTASVGRGETYSVVELVEVEV